MESVCMCLLATEITTVIGKNPKQLIFFALLGKLNYKRIQTPAEHVAILSNLVSYRLVSTLTDDAIPVELTAAHSHHVFIGSFKGDDTKRLGYKESLFNIYPRL